MLEFIERYDRLLICIFLVVCTAAVYWQVGGFEFIGGDDTSYLISNTNVNTGFNWANVKWAFENSRSYNWHPLTWISYSVDYQCNWNPLAWIWNTANGQMGDSARIHLANVFWHLVDCVLLFLLLNRMFRRVWPSAFVAVLFALYPTHVESIAWASERKDLLSTFFLILMLWAYVRYSERPNLKRYWTVLALFACGLMSKPMLVSVPLVLLVLDWWPLKRISGITDPAAPLWVDKAENVLVTAAAGLHALLFGLVGCIVTADKIDGVRSDLAQATVALSGDLAGQLHKWQIAHNISLAVLVIGAVVAAAGIILKIVRGSDIAVQASDTAVSPKPDKSTKSKKRAQPQLQAETVQPIVHRTAKPWQLILEKLPFCVLSLASCVATYLVQRNTGAMRVLATLPAGVRAANSIVAYTSYLGKMFWPVHLWIPYIHPERTLAHAAIIGSALGLIAITIFTIALAKRMPYLLAGWLWYLFTLLPVIGFVQVGPQAMADRYTYVPFIGLFLGITWLAADLCSRFVRAPVGRRPRQQLTVNIPLVLVAFVIIGLVTWRTCIQVSYWKSTMILDDHAIACDENDYIALTTTSSLLASQGDLKGALDRAERAVKAKSDYPVARDTLSNMLLHARRFDEAIVQAQMALKYRPDDGLAPINLAEAYYCKGMYAEAWKQIHIARTRDYPIDPRFIDELNARMLDPD